MQACFNPPDVLKGFEGSVPHNLYDVRWDLLALVVIGAAALLGGAKMFRWDMNQKFRGGERAWAVVAVAAWVAVGLVAVGPLKTFGKHQPPVQVAGPSSRPDEALGPHHAAPAAVAEPPRTQPQVARRCRPRGRRAGGRRSPTPTSAASTTPTWRACPTKAT